MATLVFNAAKTLTELADSLDKTDPDSVAGMAEAGKLADDMIGALDRLYAWAEELHVALLGVTQPLPFAG